ncbi:hypothetical protein [Enterococcus hermanniensis]|uniref:Uncharacterized protein n=1 Tax=Enterococcus hermanniensis TaxID=249189 RepID=A0A1L8TQ90_9ENTE|nr:hypothetical protein [Enterococcus hermanniensis]OJG46348.1 hypothetical protein RV04_GL001514 [Enterococcus hermanniensis]
MKAKDLLTAIQVDSAGELKQLSSYQFVFIKEGEQETNHLAAKIEADKIIVQKNSAESLRLNGFINLLNEAKEAEIYIEEELVFGYRLVERGIILG